jgi:predicted ATPase/DNA-binding winged helix-turn-helix (wHTH) protein
MATAYRFGNTQLLADQRRLVVDGQDSRIGARAFDLLLALVERRDRTVTKNELLEAVWPGIVVEESNLQVHISSLRKVLGPTFIATIPGRGYRCTAALDDGAGDGPGAALPGAPPLPKTIDARSAPSTNLPRELPPLYGRDADLQALRSLIDAHRLVTVVGAGGIGKSRLAQAAAHALAGRWPDGVWMVELAGVFDPALLPNVVAQVLAIKLAGQDAPLDDLVAGLAQRTLLLVLDNCEHLLDAAATLVEAILRGAPGVTLLATSQEPLHLATEQQYRVMPLAVPNARSARGAHESGAIALFEARVRAVDPRFALSDEGLAVAIDICRRLDGLPLAIELAAARVATLGLRPVRDKLDARFRLLTGGSRATLRRHQTLRAALEWSHNLLGDAERAVFRRLAVFAGGFTVELAQAVAVDAQLDEWAVLEHLSALVDKSLVVADAGDAPRYRLLESARAFALEQLACGEMAETLKRHALALRDFLQRVDGANLDGALRSDRFAALVLPELDNLRAAHAWATSADGDLQVAVELAAHAGSLIDYAVECIDWLLPLERQLEAGAVTPAATARYWHAIGAHNMVGHVLRTVQIEAAGRAYSAYEAMGEPRRIFSALIQLARHRIAQHDDAAAQAAADEARRIVRPDWPTEFRILLLRVDAALAEHAGSQDESVALRREAVRVSVSSGDWRHEVLDRNNLVDALWHVGPIEDAVREARKLAEDLRGRPAAAGDMAILFANLMGILSEMACIDEASTVAAEALPMMRRARYTYVEEWVHLFWRRGQAETAARLLGASDAERARFGTPHQVNEERLIAEARAALADELPADEFASMLAAGATLTQAEMLALISAGLEQGGVRA